MDALNDSMRQNQSTSAFVTALLAIAGVMMVFLAGCYYMSSMSSELKPLVAQPEAGFSGQDCLHLGGRVVAIAESTCSEDELNSGPVAGDQGICCIPREGGVMTLEEARAIAESSECTEKGLLTENSDYNEYTDTWWIDLEMKPEFANDMCSPACVVTESTKAAEINWRCTGALP